MSHDSETFQGLLLSLLAETQGHGDQVSLWLSVTDLLLLGYNRQASYLIPVRSLLMQRRAYTETVLCSSVCTPLHQQGTDQDALHNSAKASANNRT